MAKTKLPDELGRRERQIMDVIHRLGSASVAEVRKALPDPPTYSSVRGMLGLLEDKGHLTHEANGLRDIYKPTVSPAAARTIGAAPPRAHAPLLARPRMRPPACWNSLDMKLSRADAKAARRDYRQVQIRVDGHGDAAIPPQHCGSPRSRRGRQGRCARRVRGHCDESAETTLGGAEASDSTVGFGDCCRAVSAVGAARVAPSSIPAAAVSAIHAGAASTRTAISAHDIDSPTIRTIRCPRSHSPSSAARSAFLCRGDPHRHQSILRAIADWIGRPRSCSSG